MNHWWIAFDALLVMLGVTNLVLLVITRHRKRFLVPFAIFYAVFTANLLVALSRGYVTLNVTEFSATPVFLSYGMGTVLSCVVVVCAAWFYHRALEIQKPALLRGIAIGMALVAGLAVSPWGVRFDSITASYELLTGYLAAAVVLLGVFAYVMYLALRAVREIADPKDRMFFRGMFAFAAIGFLESAAGLAITWQNAVGKLDATSEEFLWSSIPYFLFSLFLGAYLLRLLGQAPAQRTLQPERVAALGLSTREHEIMLLVLKGLNNKRIAGELNISVATVKTHLYNIFKKAKVSSRFELAQQLQG